MLDVVERDKYLNQKVFITKIDRKLSHEDFEFVFQVFLESEELKKIVPNPTRAGISISFLDSNLTDEIYNFIYNGNLYILKISLGDGALLQKEYDVLKSIEDSEIAPIALCFDYLPDYNNIYILVTSFESGLDYKKIDYAERLKFLDCIGASLEKLHNNRKEYSEYEDFFNFYSDMINFESNLSEEIIEDLSKEKMYNDMVEMTQDLFAQAKQEIESFDENFFNKNSICHTNVQFGTIISWEKKEGDEFQKYTKFINFFSSFVINPVFDLAFTSLHMSLRGLGEDILLDNYLRDNTDLDINYINQYLDSCKSVAWKIIMCKIVALSLYEKLIHKYARLEKHIFFHDTYFNIRPFLKAQYPHYLENADAFLKL
jgi:hypothetical protein